MPTKIVEDPPATARKDVVLVVLAQTVQDVGSHAVGFRAARQIPGEDPAAIPRAALLGGLGGSPAACVFCLLEPIPGIETRYCGPVLAAP